MKSRLLVAAVGIPLLLVILFACPTIVTAVAVALLSAIGAREFLKTTGINTNEGMLMVSMAAAFLLPIWSYFGSPILVGACGAVILFNMFVSNHSLTYLSRCRGRGYPDICYVSGGGPHPYERQS